MLSILIPTYNQNITGLVSQLYKQAMDTYVDIEIIVLEDGSTSEVESNRTICNLKNCRHLISAQNIGRSAARNRLADEAKYEHLLFIDCDAAVHTPHFVEKYISFCKEDCIVIGGVAYDPHENNPDYSLRLKYGRVREARSAIERSKLNQKHKINVHYSLSPKEMAGMRSNFSTFNFLISKSIFNRVRFDESIRGYGHEDMLFGYQLHQLGYEFIQIENPLIHKGLDDNKTFLRKTGEATRNLFLLYQTENYPYLAKESTLLAAFLRIKKVGLIRLFTLKYNLTQKLLIKLLCKPNPSLLLYDLYKLLFICKTSLTK
ncbi:MAG: glycosyltransferase [Bacteroidales bacterium]|nr:glycosyltransferase [Bacteroidales bacterium]